MSLLILFVALHWCASIFFQTFFLHRYSSHRMFSMSRGWERFFHLCTFGVLGTSYMAPWAYAVLHRAHHAFSDTDRDPHTPRHFRNVFAMMWETRQRYGRILNGQVSVEPRFLGGYPEWPALDRFGEDYATKVAWGVLYTLVYIIFAPHWFWFLLLPVHFLMGPIHGAIVNWCGHKYGYRNFDTRDRSRNTLPLDFLTLGELFQNNHHRFPLAPNFAGRWFETDPGFWGIRLLALAGVVRLPEHPQQVARMPATTTRAASSDGAGRNSSVPGRPHRTKQ